MNNYKRQKDLPDSSGRSFVLPFYLLFHTFQCQQERNPQQECGKLEGCKAQGWLRGVQAGRAVGNSVERTQHQPEDEPDHRAAVVLLHPPEHLFSFLAHGVEIAQGQAQPGQIDGVQQPAPG